MDELRETRENIDALRLIPGDGRAFAITEACANIADEYRYADELALAAEVFRLWAICQGEREAEAARRASL